MPIGKFKLPDGRVGQFEVPEGTTPEQAQQIIDRQWNAAQPEPRQEISAGPMDVLKMGAAMINPAMGRIWDTQGGSSKIAESVPKAISDAGYSAGGLVTDAATGMGAPVPLAAGAGAAANAATQAFGPAIAGKVGAAIVSPALRGTGRFLMRSALNAPLKERLSGKAEQAAELMLEKGYNPTMGGVDAMRSKANDLGKQVKNVTDNSPYVMNKNDLYPYVREKLQAARTQVNPDADVRGISGAWDEFSNSIPGDILTVKQAQALKEGTYRALGDKAYGVQAADEAAKQTAQKALARGLREKIAELEPQVAPLLKEQSGLYGAAKIAERRAGTDQGLKVGGIALVAPTMGKTVAMLLDKYTLMKSLLARGLYSGAERIPQAGAGTAAALGQGLLGNKQREQDDEKKRLAAILLQGQ